MYVLYQMVNGVEFLFLMYNQRINVVRNNGWSLSAEHETFILHLFLKIGFTVLFPPILRLICSW